MNITEHLAVGGLADTVGNPGANAFPSLERVARGPRSLRYGALQENGAESGVMSRAVATALHIERDILDGCLASGTFFGSCAELSQRYDVGRQVTREAIRLIEMRGTARARPGPGGGLIVAGQAPEMVAASAGIHLMLTRTVERQDSVQARCSLGAISVALACAQPEASRHKLVDWMGQSPLGPIDGGKRACNAIGFPIALAAACGNVVAHLFSVTASATAEDLVGPETPWLVDPDAAAWSRHCEALIVAAIGEGDAATAQNLLGGYIRKLDAIGMVPQGRRSSEDVGSVISRRRAGQIARSIINDLRVRCERGEASDVALGTIDTLCEVERTSRATAVQAVRMLEMAGVITVRPGRGQGYYAKPVGLDLIASQLRDCLGAQQGALDAVRAFDKVFRADLGETVTFDPVLHTSAAPAVGRHNAALSVMATVLQSLLGKDDVGRPQPPFPSPVARERIEVSACPLRA